MNKKIIAIVIIFFIILSSSNLLIAKQKTEDDDNKNIIEFSQEFSKPKIIDTEEGLSIEIEETSNYLINHNSPKLPVFTKTFELPWETRVNILENKTSDIKTLSITKKIEPLVISKINSKLIEEENLNSKLSFYSSEKLYPNNWFDYSLGAGLNNKSQHVLFLNLYIYPVRYLPDSDEIKYINDIQITIEYEILEKTNINSNNGYDLLVIAPENFSEKLTSLVNHKNQHNLKTKLSYVQEIYDVYPGLDRQEKIKNYIKYGIENWGIKHVLLVGDLEKIPIRTTYANWFEPDILSDLYYADIYNSTFEFCSWDENNNNIYGEVNFTWGFPPKANNVDKVDLHADVHIGRLACKNNEELDIVVDKIITYENEAYGKDWFNRIILAGGDTFPPAKGSLPFIYEGQITNNYVAEQVPGFEQKRLWTSKHNLNFRTFNREINKGAGFLSYAGHGFEHGWGTYRPNAIRKKMGFIQPMYYTPYVNLLKNKDKLPIIFFDACLTSKLDFNITDLEDYFPDWMINIFLLLTKQEYDPSNIYTCFAWSFLAKDNGGAIATIGATRTAYSMVSISGPIAGAGVLDVSFFKAYEKGITLGEMFTQAQNTYISKVGKDFFTIEEYIILGDPSLKVGGYP